MLTNKCSDDDPCNQRGIKRGDTKRHMDNGNGNGLLEVGVLVRSETDGPSWLEEDRFLERTV